MGALPSSQWISGFTASAALAPDGRVALRHFAIPPSAAAGAAAPARDDCLAHWTGCDTISLMAVAR